MIINIDNTIFQNAAELLKLNVLWDKSDTVVFEINISGKDAERVFNAGIDFLPNPFVEAILDNIFTSFTNQINENDLLAAVLNAEKFVYSIKNSEYINKIQILTMYIENKLNNSMILKTLYQEVIRNRGFLSYDTLFELKFLQSYNKIAELVHSLEKILYVSQDETFLDVFYDHTLDIVTGSCRMELDFLSEDWNKLFLEECNQYIEADELINYNDLYLKIKEKSKLGFYFKTYTEFENEGFGNPFWNKVIVSRNPYERFVKLVSEILN